MAEPPAIPNEPTRTDPAPIDTGSPLEVPPADHPALDVRHVAGDLKGRSVRGGAWTGGAQGIALLLQLASTIVLARLLEPTDFGLLGMVLAFTGLFMIFQDLGLSEATIQRPQISHQQVSWLFMINAGIGLGLSLSLVAATPLVVLLYDEPRLWTLVPAMAAVFVFAGLSAQHLAVIKRQLRFKALAGVQLSASALGVTAGIVSATLGAGVWSLVALSLTTAASTTVLASAVSRWWPSWPKRGTAVGGLMRFGADVTVFNVVVFLARNADNILIGRFMGAAVLGLYTKAYGLLLLPLRQLTRPLGAVAVPGMARLQDQPARYRRYYLRVTKIMAYVTIPMIAVMAALAPELIAVALGPGWEEAADIFLWLAVAGLLQPVLASGAWVLQSLGHTASLRNLGLVTAPIYVASFVVGLPWGAQGVAASYAVVVNLTFVPMMWYSLRRSPIGLGDFLWQLGWPLVLGGFCFGLVWIGTTGLDIPAIADMLLVAPVAVAAGLALAAAISSAVRRDIRETLGLARELRGGEAASVVPPGSAPA